ncbi:MAG: hypothetical protein ACREXU_06300 [Gammaproteobacteria bacterium]
MKPRRFHSFITAAAASVLALVSAGALATGWSNAPGGNAVHDRMLHVLNEGVGAGADNVVGFPTADCATLPVAPGAVSHRGCRGPGARLGRRRPQPESDPAAEGAVSRSVSPYVWGIMPSL